MKIEIPYIFYIDLVVIMLTRSKKRKLDSENVVQQPIVHPPIMHQPIVRQVEQKEQKSEELKFVDFRQYDDGHLNHGNSKGMHQYQYKVTLVKYPKSHNVKITFMDTYERESDFGPAPDKHFNYNFIRIESTWHDITKLTKIIYKKNGITSAYTRNSTKEIFCDAVKQGIFDTELNKLFGVTNM
jgi:hypothetical protein